MKSILTLLLLVMLSSPVLANSNANTSECLRMYSTYINDYGASKFIPPKHMRSFIYRCMPTDYLNKPTHKNGQQDEGLLYINGDRERITVFKT